MDPDPACVPALPGVLDDAMAPGRALEAREGAHHPGRQAAKEPVRQYIPIDKIKRVSLLKAERLIHL